MNMNINEISHPYLTEASLGDILNQMFFGKEIIHNKKHPEFDGYRPDYYIPELKIIVEFDGYHHFTNNKVICKDVIRDKRAKELGIKLVRIPYFIQLNDVTTDYIFNYFYDIEEYNTVAYPHNYPQGFVDNKAFLPGQFTELGYQRYLKYMNQFIYATDIDKGYRVLRDVWYSLFKRVVTDQRSLLECFPDFYRNKGIADYWYGATTELTINDIELVQLLVALQYERDIIVLEQMNIEYIDESKFIEYMKAGR